MATSMEADSEVLFKEKREGKGVKTETAVEDATLRFDFRASTPATSPSGRGAEHQGGDGEEQGRVDQVPGRAMPRPPGQQRKVLERT